MSNGVMFVRKQLVKRVVFWIKEFHKLIILYKGSSVELRNIIFAGREMECDYITVQAEGSKENIFFKKN